MSWCRWSCECENGKQSDLYIYDDVYGGISVCIAKRRRIGIENAPKVPFISDVGEEVYCEAYKARMDWYDENTEFENIELEYAGESLNFDDMSELKEFLYKLKDLGYNIPNRVFEIVEYEN